MSGMAGLGRNGYGLVLFLVGLAVMAPGPGAAQPFTKIVVTMSDQRRKPLSCAQSIYDAISSGIGDGAPFSMELSPITGARPPPFTQENVLHLQFSQGADWGAVAMVLHTQLKTGFSHISPPFRLRSPLPRWHGGNAGNACPGMQNRHPPAGDQPMRMALVALALCLLAAAAQATSPYMMFEGVHRGAVVIDSIGCHGVEREIAERVLAQIRAAGGQRPWSREYRIERKDTLYFVFHIRCDDGVAVVAPELARRSPHRRDFGLGPEFYPEVFRIEAGRLPTAEFDEYFRNKAAQYLWHILSI